jgi:hypothetical protein
LIIDPNTPKGINKLEKQHGAPYFSLTFRKISYRIHESRMTQVNTMIKDYFAKSITKSVS